MAFEPIKLDKFSTRLIQFLARHPWRSLALAALILGLLVPGLAHLKPDFTYRAFFLPDDPELERYEQLQRQFGNDEAAVIGIHSPSGIFDAESIQLIRDFTARMWQVHDIIRVDALTNFNVVRAEADDIIVEPLIPDSLELTPEILAERRERALKHEVLPDYLISRDGKTAMIFGIIKPNFESVADVKRIAGEIDQIATDLAVGDHVFYQSGSAALTRAFEDVAVHDMTTMLPIVIGLTLLLSFLMLRSIPAVGFALGMVVLAVVGTLGIAGWLGVKMTNVTTALPQILIAVGIADSVHIFTSYFLAMRAGRSRHDAAMYALTKNFVATLVTAATIAVGFFSFMSAQLQPVKDIGLLGGIGTLVAWVMTYLIVGPMLFVVPFRVKQVSEENLQTRNQRAERFTAFIYRYRWAIVLFFTITTAASTWVSAGLRVNSNPYEYFAEGYPVRVANDFLRDNIGGSMRMELVVDSGREEGIKDPEFLRKVEALQVWIEDQPGVTRAISIVDVLKSTHRSLNGDDPAQYRIADNAELIGQELFLYTMGLPQGMDLNDRVSVKNDKLRLSILWTVMDSEEAMRMAHEFVEQATSLGLNAHYTGQGSLWQGMNAKVVESFLGSVFWSMLPIMVIMLLFFRNFKIAMISMIPNVIPMFYGGALLYWMGKDLDMGTVMVYSICLGISVDDTVHMLANYVQYRKIGLDAHGALRQVFDHSSGALLSTTTILVGSFGTFVFATFVPNEMFGILTAVVLTIALVTDIFFTPASLLLGEPGPKDGAEGTGH